MLSLGLHREPLLFLVPITDLGVFENISIFADDTKLPVKSKNLEELMREAEEALGEARQWF